MYFRSIVVIIFVLCAGILPAQEDMSKGDRLFFEYAYAEAINQYKKEIVESQLSNQQYLNLADSYLKIGNYKNASETYLKVYKVDSTMSTYHFNRMLQSMSRTSGLDRVKAFLATKTAGLTNELMENADFNFQLMQTEDTGALNFQIFNIEGNSPQADFSPAFYKDRLLFSSGRGHDDKNIYGPSGEAYLDIYIARKASDGNILNANLFTAIPSSPYHKGTPFYSEDLDKIFYISSNADEDGLSFDDNGKNALAIGVAEADGTFQYLLRDLSTSFYYPHYDAASSKLYFAANFEDSLGGTDIYYVHTNNGLIMSAPVNLGPRINTPGNEISPYIFENSFYYSSDVFYGIGGMDVYKSEMDADGSFSIPISLGTSINTNDDEFGFIIKDHGEKGLIGYFSSNRAGGKGNDDIYGFIVDEKPGIKTFALKGKVVNLASNRGIDKAQIRLLDFQGNTLKEVYTASDGNFRVEIPWQDGITVQSTKDKYSIFSASYSAEEMEDVQNSAFNMGLAFLDDLIEEKEEQVVIKLNKFYFTRGQYKITPEIALELDKVVDVVSRFPQLQLRIESHTDSRGGGASNFRLSQRRADAMKQYVQGKGVPSSNILFSVGYGEDKILNNCTNGVYCLEVLHKRNERQLIVVLNYKLLY